MKIIKSIIAFIIIFALVATNAFTQEIAPILRDAPPLIKQRIATLEAVKTLGLSMRIYSAQHNGQYATNFVQLTNELGGATSFYGIKLETFEFMNVGLVNETMTEKIIFREVKPRKNADGKLERVYCLSDGTAWNIISENSNFDKYEQEHSVTNSVSTK